MRKYINIVSPIIIILSLLVSFQVYAGAGEQGKNANEVRTSNEIKNTNQGDTDKIKTQVRTTREERIQKLNMLVTSVKEKRDEFKSELEKVREEARVKTTELRTQFKSDILKIKDEAKRTSSEKIVNTVDFLNAKFTATLSDKVDQIENVLTSIESRITKAETNGLDVSTVKPQVEKAKIAIADAREAIQVQTKKVYEVKITDESTLKAEMKKLRDTFMTDIKAVREKVKLAHVAVRDTATTLAKIPKIDEVDDSDDTKVEDNDKDKTEVEDQNDDNTNE